MVCIGLPTGPLHTFRMTNAAYADASDAEPTVCDVRVYDFVHINGLAVGLIKRSVQAVLRKVY